MPGARELHVPDFAFASVLLPLDILRISKEVWYMYRGVWKVGLVLLFEKECSMDTI